MVGVVEKAVAERDSSFGFFFWISESGYGFERVIGD